jgi:hypothetical protein
MGQQSVIKIRGKTSKLFALHASPYKGSSTGWILVALRIVGKFSTKFSTVLKNLVLERVLVNLVLRVLERVRRIHTKFKVNLVLCTADYLPGYCQVDWDKTGASRSRGGRARDFVNFRKKNSCIARALGVHPSLTVYPPRIQISKIKNRTSSRHKPKLSLWRDEVRFLIFDDPAEL